MRTPAARRVLGWIGENLFGIAVAITLLPWFLRVMLLGLLVRRARVHNDNYDHTHTHTNRRRN